MEADLQHYYNIDIADLYVGKLSFRRLSVLLTYLPADSATWAVRNDIPHGWTLTDLLVTDLFQAFTGEVHPARPTGKEQAESERAKQLAAQLLAQRERLTSSN